MKKTIGIVALFLAFGLTSTAQNDLSNSAKSIHKNAKNKVEEKAQEVKKKAIDYKDEKTKEIQSKTAITEKANQISQATKSKYLSMKEEDIEALPLAEKAQAKRAIFEKTVNVSDMKSAGAQMRISGVKTRLKKALDSGEITDAEYKAKMEKVANAETSLKAYRNSIKNGRKLLK